MNNSKVLSGDLFKGPHAGYAIVLYIKKNITYEEILHDWPSPLKESNMIIVLACDSIVQPPKFEAISSFYSNWKRV